MKKAKILIVEDEAITAMELESQLQSLGYEVTSIVDTGEKAIEKAEADKPDLMLMDIRIKGEMDGIETAEVIRNRFGIPVIFSTAYLDQERIERAKITMPFGYVLKPIQERDLKVTIEMTVYVAEVEAKRKRMENLLRIQRDLGISLGKSMDLQEMLQFCMKAALEASNMDSGGIYILDPATKSFELTYHEGLSGDFVAAVSTYNADSPNSQLLMTGDPVYANHDQIGVNLTKVEQNEKLKSMAIIPVKHTNQIVGCLNVASHTFEEISLFVRNTLEIIVTQIGDAIYKKQVEEALKESKEELTKAQEIAHIGNWYLDFATNQFVWSEELYKMYGFDPSFPLPLFNESNSLFTPESWELLSNSIAKTGETGIPYEIELKLAKKDGRTGWIWARGEAVLDKNGKIVGLRGATQDITERKQSEEALKKSEQDFRQLVENSLVGILILQNDRIIFQNPVYKKITQVSPDHVQENFYENIFRDDRALLENAFEKLLTGKSKTVSVQFRLIVKSEGEIDLVQKRVQSLTSLIKYQGKDALLINIMDITKMYNMEQYVNVQEKMSALGRISAGIAHEIRNPLTGINTYLYSLKKFINKENFDPEKKQRAGQLIGQIEIASRKIESVVKLALDFSKPGTPSFVLTDINKVISEIIEYSRSSLNKANINIQVSLTKNPTTLHADPRLIGQIILNLINNSVEALKSIESEKIIDVSSSTKNGVVIVKIADSGPGIKPEIRHKIFDPFFSTDQAGSGIGLSIVKRIITDHTGKISISESSYGGAMFQIELPNERRDTH
jgi:PAS domain S-box-containing protein